MAAEDVRQKMTPRLKWWQGFIIWWVAKQRSVPVVPLTAKTGGTAKHYYLLEQLGTIATRSELQFTRLVQPTVLQSQLQQTQYLSKSATIMQLLVQQLLIVSSLVLSALFRVINLILTIILCARCTVYVTSSPFYRGHKGTERSADQPLVTHIINDRMDLVCPQDLL